MASTLPRILGPNVLLVLTYGAGNVSISNYTKIQLEEAPTNKESNVAASGDDLKVFLKRKCKVTCTGLRGINNCYSDLPRAEQRITKIEFKYKDEDGDDDADTKDLPDLNRSGDNPGGYILFAVAEKRGMQDEGSGDFEMVIESGYLNAKDFTAPAAP